MNKERKKGKRTRCKDDSRNERVRVTKLTVQKESREKLIKRKVTKRKKYE